MSLNVTDKSLKFPFHVPEQAVFSHYFAGGPHLNGRKIRGPLARVTKYSLHVIARHIQSIFPYINIPRIVLFCLCI